MQTAAVERFECDQCGACCRQLLIQADWLDVQREPRLTQADRHYASLPILGAQELLQDEYRAVLLNGEKGCHFLRDNKCSIYPRTTVSERGRETSSVSSPEQPRTASPGASCSVTVGEEMARNG
ncbi:MAG: YkgJ family cysteine cluster protein [Planctomycetaceae bacterium]|nr:YkgJ family cysteine cluster protein [Planctomycetaceae bacterium]